MKKIFVRLGILIGVIVIIAIVGGIIIHKPLPKGQAGADADALARQVLDAINDSAWKETGAVAWTFPGGHEYVWDRKRHWVKVTWSSYTVLLRINPRTGRVWKNEEEIIDIDKRQEILDKAWKYWVNDSFWLNAPSKVFDSGTQRYIVHTEDDQPSLLVTYTQGGATPGDSYLWHLDEKGLPQSWELWVNIIPIGGLAFSWEGWERLSTGALISSTHKHPLFTLSIENIQGASTLEMLTEGVDPFAALEE